MGNRFEGKVAFITGGGSGLGQETARVMGRDGAAIAIADMNEDGGKATVSELQESGIKALFVKCDVSDPDSVRAAVDATVAEFGRLDYGINNAGIGGAAAAAGDYGVDDWHKVISINLDGVFYCIRAEVPEMRKVGGGVIINISSILGLVGFGMAPAYTAAKHGVMGLTRAAALDHAAENIRVVAINPGFIETPLLKSGGIEKGTDVYDMVLGLHPIGRLGQPVDIANTVAWLCSDEASFVTGMPMIVDGGYTAR